MTKTASDQPRVVIIGGGFGGLAAAQTLRRAPVKVTLIDRHNFHLFQPLLYQVATGALSPANIASPLRYVLRRQPNAQVLLAEVTDIDVANHRVVFRNGTLPYDTLIVATGAHHDYFGNDGWAQYAPGLKTIENAIEIRARILTAFERAEHAPDPAKQRAHLTFVIVGAGPTGVELAGAIGEIARDTLRSDFRTIDTKSARILLVEGADRVLPAYPEDLSAKAEQALTRLGVEVRCGTLVTNVRSDEVTLQACGEEQVIPTHTVLWAAGARASGLGRVLTASTGAELDRMGRVIVEPDLSLPNFPDIFVIGDLAHFHHQTGHPLAGLAPVAKQQGRYVAKLIKQRLAGGSLPPFRYRDHGTMATIGRTAAVADLGWARFSGFFAWLAWLFIHLINIVEYENRLHVLLQWAWNYVTRNRSARLITNRSSDDPPSD